MTTPLPGADTPAGVNRHTGVNRQTGVCLQARLSACGVRALAVSALLLWSSGLSAQAPAPGLQPGSEALLLSSATPGQSDEQMIDRSGFAAPGQSTWTALTDYEQSLLTLFVNAEQNGQRPDAGALLALYLLASGDVRHAHEVAALQQNINNFFTEHADVLDIRDEAERGARLLQRMHEYFLRADQRSPLAAYHEDQSRLSELLRTGIYNCISSALLYLVLAEQAGLTTAGVIMPSHAFVQITLPDGRVADVETTTADGFDVVRDEAFFSRRASDWFESRRLVVPSFADYEQRRIVSAAGLGYESMWSQHTTESRMAYSDRLRLAEIRGELQLQQPDAQHNRLVYYYREAEYLRKQNDLASADRLIARITPFLARFNNIIAPDVFSDAVSAVPLLLLQAERADWLLRHGGDTDSAVTLAFDVLSQVDSAAMNGDVMRDLAYKALNNHVLALLGNNQFDEARAVIDQLPADCAASGFCINALEQYYISHARQFWQQRNWPRTIALYEEYLALGLQTDNRAIFAGNLETVYLNQAEQHWFDEERNEAESVLEVCIIKAPQSERCLQRLQAARQGR